MRGIAPEAGRGRDADAEIFPLGKNCCRSAGSGQDLVPGVQPPVRKIHRQLVWRD